MSLLVYSRLEAGANIGLAPTPYGALIISSTDTTSITSVGTGTSLVFSSTQVKSLAQGSNITLTDDLAGTVTVAATSAPAHSRVFARYVSDANLGANAFLHQVGANNTETNTRLYTPAAGTLTRLSVWLSVAPGVGETRTLTVRVGNGNGAAAGTALVVSISGTATSGQTSANVALVANDYVTIQNTHPTNPGVADSRVYAVLDWIY